MDPRNDIREFLVSRRARITPGEAGLPAYGSNRQKLLVYSAEPGSASHQALHLLASWASTPRLEATDRRST